MKKIIICMVVLLFTAFNGFSYISIPEPVKFKGFYIGMSKSKVQEVYKKLQADKFAEYISIESENYRDIIKIDNEFSSMGNKVEVFYNESGRVTGITFQYKTVSILFKNCSQSAEEFMEAFTKEYDLPKMEFNDMGMVKTWKCKLESEGFQISIDNSKNLRIQMLKK